MRLVDAEWGLDGVFLGVVAVFLAGDLLVVDLLTSESASFARARTREELLVRAIVDSEI